MLQALGPFNNTTPIPSNTDLSSEAQPDTQSNTFDKPSADCNVDTDPEDDESDTQSLSDSDTSTIHPDEEVDAGENEALGSGNTKSIPEVTTPTPNKDDSTLPPREGIDRKAALRVLNHLTGDNTDLHLRYLSQAYKQGTAAMYRFFCDLIGVNHSVIKDNLRTAKRLTFDLLILSVCLLYTSYT